MRNQAQLVLALIVIAVGVVLLVASVLQINVWVLCFPVLLVLLGLAILFRPQLVGSDSDARYKLLGDIRRSGDWAVADEELWIGVGDVRLDMTAADIPYGDTQIRVWSFVSSVQLSIPDDVGVTVSSSAFITDAKFLGRKRDGILTPVRFSSDDYETAERRIRLENTAFVGDVSIKRVSSNS
jgi:predicted membrane protein